MVGLSAIIADLGITSTDQLTFLLAEGTGG